MGVGLCASQMSMRGMILLQVTQFKVNIRCTKEGGYEGKWPCQIKQIQTRSTNGKKTSGFYVNRDMRIITAKTSVCIPPFNDYSYYYRPKAFLTVRLL